MPDLTTELREYSRGLVDGIEPVTFDEIVGLAPSSRPPAEPSATEMEPFAPSGVARERRTRTRRRTLATIAAAIALIGVSIGLLMNAGGDPRSVEITPADSDATTDPAPATTVATSVAVAAVLPPEGQPASTPETGELVAAIAFSRWVDFPGADRWKGTSVNLYADGRVLWAPADGVPGGVAESRLSSEGVDLARSEFRSVGLFDAGRAASTEGVWDICACIIRVADEGGVRSTVLPSPDDLEPARSDPQVEREVDRLVTFVTTLWSELPASAWEAPEPSVYVASRYQVCAWDDGIPADRAVPDLSSVLTRLLGPRLVQMLDAAGWEHSSWGDCVDLTLADARLLVDGLTEAGLRPAGPMELLGPLEELVYRTLVPGPSSSQDLSIGLQPLLPDGEPPLFAPG